MKPIAVNANPIRSPVENDYASPAIPRDQAAKFFCAAAPVHFYAAVDR